MRDDSAISPNVTRTLVNSDSAVGTAAIILLMLFIRRLPYAVRSSAAILKQIKSGVEEAANSLGARPGRAFLRSRCR